MSDKYTSLIEVQLLKDPKIIKETLARIGIANQKTKILYPSCYLYKNFEKHYICHFKELFVLTRDNGYNNLSEDDIKRRNAIIFCLKKWGLISVDEKKIQPYDVKVFVLKHEDVRNWTIQHKFNSATLIVE